MLDMVSDLTNYTLESNGNMNKVAIPFGISRDYKMLSVLEVLFEDCRYIYLP